MITDAQASRYPLLDRTREWMSGQQIAYPDIQPLRRGCSGRVLVIAHVYYPEIWPELADRIKRIPVPHDIVVTLVDGHSAGLVDEIVSDFPRAVIETQPNQGRDIWPLVHVAELGLIGDYDAVLKLTRRGVRTGWMGTPGGSGSWMACAPHQKASNSSSTCSAVTHGSEWWLPLERFSAGSSGARTPRSSTRWLPGPGSPWTRKPCGSRAVPCSGVVQDRSIGYARPA